MSIIIVSDVHLGDESSKYMEFSQFIDWIGALEKEGGKNYKLNGKEILLKPPEKLILLGDILELWSPIKNDMKYTFQQAFAPFGKLACLGCEKIFVLGNHDEDISEYLDVQMKLEDGSEIKENIFKITSDFTIINRHYPADSRDKTKGFLQVGKYKYFFIHGQQFDRLFISVGPLANIPTYMAKISSAFSKVFIPNGWSIVAAFAVLAILYVIFQYDVLYTLSVVTLLLSVPRLFTYLQDLVWARIKEYFSDRPKYKDVKTIIENKYYDVNKDKTDWDVNMIFGHTHIPEIHRYKFKENEEDHEWLFLNSGSWVEEKYPHNTFIYLDETGYYLFKWDPSGNINLIPANE